MTKGGPSYMQLLRRISPVGALASTLAAVLLTLVAAAPAQAVRDVRVRIHNQTDKPLTVKQGTLVRYVTRDSTTYAVSVKDEFVLPSHGTKLEVTVNEPDLVLELAHCGTLRFSNPLVGFPGVTVGAVGRNNSWTPEATHKFTENEHKALIENGHSYEIWRTYDSPSYKNFTLTVESCAA